MAPVSSSSRQRELYEDRCRTFADSPAQRRHVRRADQRAFVDVLRQSHRVIFASCRGYSTNTWACLAIPQACAQTLRQASLSRTLYPDGDSGSRFSSLVICTAVRKAEAP